MHFFFYGTVRTYSETMQLDARFCEFWLNTGSLAYTFFDLG